MTQTQWLASDDPRAMLDFVADPSPSAPRISDRKLRLFACAVARLALPRSTFPRAAKAIEIGEWYADGADLTCQPGAGEGTPFHSFPAPTAADRLAMACCSDGAVEAAQMAAETWANGTVPPAARIALLLEVVGNPFRPVTLPHGSGCPSWPGPKTRTECGCTCDWLTPTVLSLAQAAYDERPGRECQKCQSGEWYVTLEEGGVIAKDGVRRSGWKPCPFCNGTGTIDDGTLDPVRLAVLSDALEEAGCIADCATCGGKGQVSQDHPWGNTFATEWLACPDCDGEKHLPHPLVAHLRSPGVHVRGCWALDCVLGKG